MNKEIIIDIENPKDNDLISRQAVLDIDFNRIIYTTAKPAEMVRQKIEQLPPVTPQPKTGHWISHYDEDAKEGWYECDRCHTERAFNTDYCPDCGARMERSDKE